MSPDTSTFEGPLGFATTQWSIIRGAKQGHADERRRNLDRLMRKYDRAVYAYIRAKWGYGNEESKDLTQDFFLWLLEGDTLDRARKDAGRFRNYLRTALSNYLCNRYRAGKTQKRGGKNKTVSLEDLAADGFEPGGGETPEATMDREWRRILMEQARGLLQQEYLFKGKPDAFRAFEEYYFGLDPCPTQEKLAAKVGATITQVNNWVHEARGRFSLILRDLVSETVSDPESLKQEMRELFDL